MTQETKDRTLYVVVDHIDAQGNERTRGDSVTYAVDDREGSEMLRRGVLSTKPVRREAGQSSGRSERGRKA
jgi:hypothetical protein